MLGDIYTIGYAGMSINRFKEVLKEFRITDVVDVRSDPYSKRYCDYSIGPLSATLKRECVRYVNWREFGARQPQLSYYTADGYLDFELYGKSFPFQTRLKDLINGIKEKKVFLLLCAEADPSTCHRSILIGRQLSENGIAVVHIKSDGKWETQEHLEGELIKRFFPTADQLSIFDTENDRNRLRIEAYKLKNKEIGYRMRYSEERNVV